MSEFDQLYREVILDHYKNPRDTGARAARRARGGTEPALRRRGVDLRRASATTATTIEDVGFEGRGCAICQAATSMLTELVKGRRRAEVARCRRTSCSRRSASR